MKTKRLFTLTLCLAITFLSYATENKAQKDFIGNIYNYIENLDVFEYGQEESRAYYIPKHHKLLNGTWKFYFADTVEGIPTNFYEENFKDSKWSTIDVPSNWEMRGFGDALFRNVSAPFNANPPFTPREYNPTGAYRTTFNIPAEWKGEEVFLRFEKVASASFLWINGQEVGYNEGAQEPAEYNITPYLKKGRNTLAMMVVKYSDGYYLEGQDYWRLAGIFDDVYLYSTPKTRLFDWYVTTDLDNEYRDAELNIEATIKSYDEQPIQTPLKVKAVLTDAAGNEVATFESRAASFAAGSRSLSLNLKQHIVNPLKWTAETPNLYNLKMYLIDAATGAQLEDVRQDVGFKETAIINNVFLLNGKPLKVNAQNTHMQHPEDGHRVTDELIKQDMQILKRYGFNAVRISHYPPTPRYLEYAARYGLYIIDEAGVEAHATEYVSNDKRFVEMYRERARRMVLRDRNQPAVLFWSAGNESGEGPNIGDVIDEGRKYDHTRSWMYGGNAYSHKAEEIIGPRYPTPLAMDLKVGRHGDGDVRPSFMDEYISVAGNGGGMFDEMWRAVYTHERSLGGAVWDFVSPGLTQTARALKDASPNGVMAHIMGNAKIVTDKRNKKNHVIDLNGHDQWVEVYRDNCLEISDDALSISFDVFPRKLISSCGSFVTKGEWQYGVQQNGKEEIIFYINTNKAPASATDNNAPRWGRNIPRNHKYELKAKLPADWEYNWHHVEATYDGKQMTFSIDGTQVAAMEAQGDIINAPFPVNIGRNEQSHGQDTRVYICDALMDNVIISGKQGELLNLNFESEEAGDKYFSWGLGARTYGTIWPDRTVQPEIHQMQKSTQPISCKLLSADDCLVEVWNRNHFLNASYYNFKWALYEDGTCLQEGQLALDIAPLSKQIITLPYQRPAIKPGCEYRLMLTSSLSSDEMWAEKGTVMAWDQLELPWKQAAIVSDKAVGKATLNQTAEAIIVSGEGFCYTFTPDGQLYSIKQGEEELLKSPLQLNIWRAPLAVEVDSWSQGNISYNNRKAWNGSQIANEYYSNNLHATTRLPISCEAYESNGQVYINVRCFSQFGVINTSLDAYIFGVRYNGFSEVYEYRINGDGTMAIHHILEPEGSMPELLPRIGLTMTLNDNMQQVKWYGRGPEENYPDRKSGYAVGIYTNNVDDMFEPYLIPQDCGLRCDNRWLEMSNPSGRGLRFSMDQLFNFNAYHYSTDNLTKAVYTYQLQQQDGITLNLDYNTTGVGCTACYVLPGYQVKPTRYERNLTIKLF